MNSQHPQDYRDRSDIIADLERLGQEDGFAYTFCLLVIKHLWSPIVDSGALKDWNQHLSFKELSFLLGLMAKQPLRLDVIPSEEVAEDQGIRAFELFGELHQSYGSLFNVAIGKFSKESRGQEEFQSAMQQWLESSDRIVEPIFYGEDGAFDFQYIELAEKRYAKDKRWLNSYVGSSFEAILKIPMCLKRLSGSRFRSLQPSESFEEYCQQVFSIFVFSADEIAGNHQESVSGFLKTFSCEPGGINEQLDNVGAYNQVVSHPLIRIDHDRYFLPIGFNLAQSIYESPFYWFLGDSNYEETGLKNRGDATEAIAFDMLRKVFGDQNVYRGVSILKGKSVIGEIDVLAIAGNKTVIVQAKSKKLTELSKRGEIDSLKQDFKEAVQEAYDQGLSCRTAILGKSILLIDSAGETIELHEDIDDAYILCLTGDHYPAVIAQMDAYLQKQETDPYPPSMSVFDLEILTFYLEDPFELLYYLRQRSTHSEHFITDSEMSFLAFHLSNKLYPDERSEATGISSGFAQLIDANFLAAKGQLLKTEVADSLFHKWKNEEFDQLVEFVKTAGIPGFTDALFFLYDLSGAGADNLIKVISNRKSATRFGGHPQSASLPPTSETGGISFICYPQSFMSAEDHFLFSAKAWKYKNEADEWLALGSIAGSSQLVDMICYSKEKWEYDCELEKATRILLKHGTMMKSDRKKIGRNDPCFCESGLKYKKCHGR